MPAVAVALSPIPIIAAVLVLGSPKARSTGPAFALGWVFGLALVSVGTVLLLGSGTDPDTETGIGWFRVVAGILFLVLAVKEWKKRPRDGEAPEMPGWMEKVNSLSASRGLLLGLALSAGNPKNLALSLTAAGSIAEAGLDGTDTAIALAAFVGIGSITVLGAVLFHAFDAERAARPLGLVRDFMTSNSSVIMMVIPILILLGVKLIGDGLGGI